MRIPFPLHGIARLSLAMILVGMTVAACSRVEMAYENAN